MTRPGRRLRPFTPSAESGASLEGRTVGRDPLLQLIADRLDSAARSGNRAHTLIVGPRGSGKSHVIEVALHRLALRPDAQDRLVVVQLDEDAVGITRVPDVLAEVCRALGETPSNDATAMKRSISSALAGRVLVLVVHNLDRIFHSIGTTGQQDLRSWVETSGDVMLLASSPALFPGIRNRDRPWYNNLAVSHLDELTVAQGRDLLERLAREYGDDALAGFIATDDGEARLKAVHALAGGSPRIWMILSECLTVEVLDDLVLAVEGLLEGLVPYYQQLLWDLSGNEQRLVRALAEGPHAAATVSELAAAAGIEQRSVATTLGRLADIHWVVPEKAPGLDRRTTWYRLAEPMLRHHLQYRAAGRQPLPLIVELLRAAFGSKRSEREAALAMAGSQAERLFLQSLEADPRRFDRAWASRNIAHLLVEARRWATGHDADRRTVAAGQLIEAVVMTAGGATDLAQKTLDLRRSTESSRAMAERVAALASKLPDDLTDTDRVGVLLDAVAAQASGRDRAVLELVATGWNSHGDMHSAANQVTALKTEVQLPLSDPLALDLAMEEGRWRSLISPAGGPSAVSGLLGPVRDARGVDHPDTLEIALWSAFDKRESRDYDAARTDLIDLVARYEHLHGRSHPDTFLVRNSLAAVTGHAGDVNGALALSRELVDDVVAAGTDVSSTLEALARVDHAWWQGESGDRQAACRNLVTLLTDSQVDLPARSARLARSALTVQLSRALDERTAGVPDPTSPEPDLVELLLSAAGGDDEARVRLPSELLDVIDELRTSEEAPA